MKEKQHEESNITINELVNIQSKTLLLSEDFKDPEETTNMFSSKKVYQEKNISTLDTSSEARLEKMVFNKKVGVKI